MTGFNPSEELLHVAQQELAKQPAAVQARVQLHQGTIEQVDEVVGNDNGRHVVEFVVGF